MKLDPTPAIIAFCFLSLLGIGSYWYLSHFDSIPQKLLDGFYLYAGISAIPFLIWMCFGHTDKEYKEIIEKEKKEKLENDAIKARYDSMPDLEAKTGVES